MCFAYLPAIETLSVRAKVSAESDFERFVKTNLSKVEQARCVGESQLHASQGLTAREDAQQAGILKRKRQNLSKLKSLQNLDGESTARQSQKEGDQQA